MIGDVGKRIFIENTLSQRANPRMKLHLDFEPLKDGDHPIMNPKIVMTRGCYYIKYTPLNKYGGNNSNPYTINSDLLPKCIMTFKNENDLYNYEVNVVGTTKVNQEIIDFILNKTTFSKDIIRIATENPYLEIPFTIDITKIEKELKKKMGIRKAYPVFKSPDTIDDEDNKRRLFGKCK